MKYKYNNLLAAFAVVSMSVSCNAVDKQYENSSTPMINTVEDSKNESTNIINDIQQTANAEQQELTTAQDDYLPEDILPQQEMEVDTTFKSIIPTIEM